LQVDGVQQGIPRSVLGKISATAQDRQVVLGLIGGEIAVVFPVAEEFVFRPAGDAEIRAGPQR